MASANADSLLGAVSEVRRAAHRLTRRLRTERSADALSTNKLAVLSHLYRNGPTTAGRIAAVEHQRPQSLTRVFAELERAGLIARTSSPRDRRQSVLELTARAGGRHGRAGRLAGRRARRAERDRAAGAADRGRHHGPARGRRGQRG